MRHSSIAAAVAIAVGLGSQTSSGQSASPEEVAAIETRLAELNKAIAALPAVDDGPDRIVDVTIYAKATEWTLRHGEFYKPTSARETLAVLDAGLARAARLAQNKPDWGTTGGRAILAYRSRIDASVQPYAISLPDGFEPGGSRRWPLHVVLHGRGDTLNEVSFIRQHDGKPPVEGQDWIQLDVFGRTNNAYRWSGETDVFEALADVARRFRIDEARITLWGFSMGGAGAWHLGLHHPSRWSSVGAGAGFVDFYRYQKVAQPLPEYQDRTLRIYDAIACAANLADVPFITYGGELDPQLAASLHMRDLAAAEEVPLKVIIGPQMGHKFDDASKKKFMEFHAAHSATGRPPFPGRRDIRFVTSTPKYNSCEWLTVEELEEMYVPAEVSSTINDGVLGIATANVRALSVARGTADRVRIDDAEEVDLNAAADGSLPVVYFVKSEGSWQALDYDASLAFEENPDRGKRHNLQGPIDDAFMEPFLCVRGTGQPWSAAHEAWAQWTLDRFDREFDRWLRGRIRVVDDTALTPEQIAAHHLVLFGDPGSNAVLAQIADRLPIEWDRDGYTVRGERYGLASHGVALVFPNPLNPARYVVLNSGHTFHEREFRASNAQLFPRLGDVAVIGFEGDAQSGYQESVRFAELFDATWSWRD